MLAAVTAPRNGELAALGLLPSGIRLVDILACVCGGSNIDTVAIKYVLLHLEQLSARERGEVHEGTRDVTRWWEIFEIWAAL